MHNERSDHEGRVIVGVDDHKGGVVTLRCAAEEARRRHAVLVAVTVWSPYGGEAAERALPCPELDAAQKASAQAMLDAACEGAGLPDLLPVRRRVERGLLGPVLARLAHGPQDLLVIGLRHLRAFASLRPSPDRYCLRNAAAPLLIVPPDWAPGAPGPAAAV
ncbi:universal stress protein [Streptomyces sp. Caat 7-52]|uniref:universal stress protein n=1 Tax=Streptomyces sp. Caat 7-52 TaxID=2949637 RepID=UPI0020364432|nr:universal stress protein [Streptomyces sp. Caat 7-52]